jgi:hypothetical protein
MSDATFSKPHIRQGPESVPSTFHLHNLFHKETLLYYLLISCFRTGIHIRILYAFLVHHVQYTCPPHHNFLDFTVLTLIGDLCKSQSFLLCNILNIPSIPSLSDPDIVLSTLFSDTCNLFSSPK